MQDKVKIAIDAMGGDNSPDKVLDGIEISLKNNKENFFYLYGNKKLLEEKINKKENLKNNCKIIEAEDVILDDESPLAGAKKVKKQVCGKLSIL